MVDSMRYEQLQVSFKNLKSSPLSLALNQTGSLTKKNLKINSCEFTFKFLSCRRGQGGIKVFGCPQFQPFGTGAGQFKTNHRWSCVSSELSWVEVSRFFLDHGTRVEMYRTTFLVSKCLEIGAEVSQSVLMPKCLVAEVSGNLWDFWRERRTVQTQKIILKLYILWCLRCIISVIYIANFS